MVDEKGFKRFLEKLEKQIDDKCIGIGRALMDIEYRKTTDDLKCQWEGIRNQERDLKDSIAETLAMRKMYHELKMLDD